MPGPGALIPGAQDNTITSTFISSSKKRRMRAKAIQNHLWSKLHGSVSTSAAPSVRVGETTVHADVSDPDDAPSEYFATPLATLNEISLSAASRKLCVHGGLWIHILLTLRSHVTHSRLLRIRIFPSSSGTAPRFRVGVGPP